MVNALSKATYSTRSRGSQPAGCSTVGLDADPVVDGISEMLLAAKIPLGCLHGDVPKQKLDLVQFTSSIAAQSSASPSEVVRGKFFNGCFFGAVLHDMPHNPLRHTTPQVLPARQTHRNTRPSLIPAETSHESIVLFTQSGTGTVRMCRPLPTKSTIAQ